MLPPIALHIAVYPCLIPGWQPLSPLLLGRSVALVPLASTPGRVSCAWASTSMASMALVVGLVRGCFPCLLLGESLPIESHNVFVPNGSNKLKACSIARIDCMPLALLVLLRFSLLAAHPAPWVVGVLACSCLASVMNVAGR